MQKTEAEQGQNLVYYAAWIVLGGVAAMIVCILVLLVGSILISRGVVGEGAMHQTALIACVLGGIFGGHMAVKRCATRTLLVGLGAGVVFFLILLTIGTLGGMLAANSNANAGGSGSTIGTCCACLCGGAIAGLLGTKQSKPRKKRRK
ncbi:MAG: TIGR04086 family membrane protein [Oscillospiraceae bacterium]|nr:TIGR04086 family membrane protein [Oscillospiraceae bacterium]